MQHDRLFVDVASFEDFLYRPVIEHYASVGDLLHFGDLQRVDEDGLAFLGEFQDELVDLRLGADVYALRGVVEQQDVRLRVQPAR